MKKLNFKLHKRGFTALALGLILVTAIAVAVPMVCAATTPNQVTAYINKLTGEVRITNVGSFSTNNTPALVNNTAVWTPVTWAVQGPQGPAGATGAAGAAGANGVNGLNIIGGLSGWNLEKDHTNYIAAFGSGMSHTESDVQVVMPVAGTLSNFTVKLAQAPGSGKTYTFTVRVNGVDTSVTCSISNSATANSSTGTLPFSAGNTLDIRVVPNGSGTGFAEPHMSWSATISATTPS